MIEIVLLVWVVIATYLFLIETQGIRDDIEHGGRRPRAITMIDYYVSFLTWPIWLIPIILIIAYDFIVRPRYTDDIQWL